MKFIHFNKEQIDNIISLYEQRNSLHNIGKVYGVSKNKIKKVLIENNVSIRTSAESSKNRKVSPEGKLKISLARKGEKNSMYKKSLYSVWIDKYGVEVANEMMTAYKEKMKVSVSEAHSKFRFGFSLSNDIQYFINKHGEDLGIKIYEDLCNKRKFKTGYSKISQKLFTDIFNYIGSEYNKIYFAELNEEYAFFSKSKRRFILLDFVIEDLKLCIEFNGDYWHANTLNTEIENYYNSSEELKSLKDKIHLRDLEKNDIIENEMGFSLLIVNELDYLQDPEKILNNCIRFINERN